ncbi:MAG TPA: hypothetical protein IAC83_05700 [Euryarchaeota archaeon]|nr:hypothetical protein [Euryarchaeota archaeon]
MDFELMFCPYCGGNIDSSDESRYLCKECGKSIYTDRESLSHFIRPGELVDSFKDALAALEDDNTNKAISIADDILKASEDKDFDAYFLRGAVYAHLGEDGKAANDWRKGMELLTVYTNIDAYVCLMSRCISEMIYSKEEEFIDFHPVKYIDALCDGIHQYTGESCKAFFYYNIYLEYRKILGRRDKNSDEVFNEIVPKLFRRVVAYHRNLWCLTRVIEEYLASIGYDPDTYEDDELEDAHIYDLLAKCLKKYTSDMTVEELHAIMEKWDDEKLKANEELLDAIMPHQSGVLGKLLSRKNEPEPVEPEVAVENYVRHLLLLDVQDQPPAEPSDCE